MTCVHISSTSARSFSLCQMQEVSSEESHIFEKPRLALLETFTWKSRREISLWYSVNTCLMKAATEQSASAYSRRLSVPPSPCSRGGMRSWSQKSVRGESALSTMFSPPPAALGSDTQGPNSLLLTSSHRAQPAGEPLPLLCAKGVPHEWLLAVCPEAGCIFP